MVVSDISTTTAQSEGSTHLKGIFKNAENLRELRGFFQEIEKGSTPEEYEKMAIEYKNAYAEALRQADNQKFKAELLKNATPEILLDCLIETAFLYEPKVLTTLWKRLFPWG